MVHFFLDFKALLESNSSRFLPSEQVTFWDGIQEQVTSESGLLNVMGYKKERQKGNLIINNYYYKNWRLWKGTNGDFWLNE